MKEFKPVSRNGYTVLKYIGGISGNGGQGGEATTPFPILPNDIRGITISVSGLHYLYEGAIKLHLEGSLNGWNFVPLEDFILNDKAENRSFPCFFYPIDINELTYADSIHKFPYLRFRLDPVDDVDINNITMFLTY